MVSAYEHAKCSPPHICRYHPQAHTPGMEPLSLANRRAEKRLGSSLTRQNDPNVLKLLLNRKHSELISNYVNKPILIFFTESKDFRLNF